MLINTGAAQFVTVEPPATTGDGPLGLDVADLNGDGDLDVVVANNAYGANTLSIFFGNGDGTLSWE